MQVSDRPSPDAPSLTQVAIVQMVYSGRHILDFTMHRALRKRRVFDFFPISPKGTKPCMIEGSPQTL